MTIALHELQAFIERCDPQRALYPGDPMYVPLDEGQPVRGSDGRSCIDALAQTVRLRDPMRGATCQLFTGFPGSGKTTELRLLAARLREDKVTPTHVVLIDFEEYLDIFTPLSITDVLRVLAYALDREATVEEGGDPKAPPGYVKRLIELLTRTDVELKELGFDLDPASLMLELKNNPSFHQKMEEVLARRFQAFAEEARDVIGEATVRLRRATHAQRIVIIVDGLEKLTPLRPEDRSRMEESVEAVFVQHAAWLRIPSCHTIYTFPIWLRFRAAPLGTLYDRDPQVLPMVKIAEPDGTVYRAGVEKLTDMVSRRLDLRAVFGDASAETLDALRRNSGGYPRDLLRLVREVLYDARSFPVTTADVERVLNRASHAYGLVIRDADLDVLTEVARTHTVPRGDAARIAHFGGLLQQWLILAYRNGDEWYHIHPLVRRAPAVARHLAARPAP